MRYVLEFFTTILPPLQNFVNTLFSFEFPHFFQKVNHLQNKKAKTLH